MEDMAHDAESGSSETESSSHDILEDQTSIGLDAGEDAMQDGAQTKSPTVADTHWTGLIGALLELKTDEHLQPQEVETEDTCSTQASEEFGSMEPSDGEFAENIESPVASDTGIDVPSDDTVKDANQCGEGQATMRLLSAQEKMLAKQAAQEAQAKQWQMAQYQQAHYQAAQWQMAQYHAARMAQWQQAQAAQAQAAQAAYSQYAAQVAQFQANQAKQWQANQAKQSQRSRAARR